MPHMTLLGFMCPGLGKSIRSWVLSHHAINKPHDMSPLSYSLSPDQPLLLYTPLVFATYHAIYGTCTATSTPIIAFVLISPVHTDNKGWQNTPHLTHLTLHLCLTLALVLCLTPCTCTLPHACTCTLPPLLHYLFTYLASLSGCIQLDSLLFHSFSLIITTSPIHISHFCTLTHVCVHTCTTPLLFSPLHPHTETVPYPLIPPSEPHRAFVVMIHFPFLY